MERICIVDDDPAQRNILCSILRMQKYSVSEADSVQNALLEIQKQQTAVVLTDLKMKNSNGLDIFSNLKEISVAPEIIVMTAFGSVETAVKAMRLGAYDYLTKPLELDELVIVVQRAVEKFNLRLSSSVFKNEIISQVTKDFVSDSVAMKQILELAQKVADNDATVLIQGPSGTGKERIARIIHYMGTRGTKPMQCINCAAFPETLLESELFGYEKGAFTGAQCRKIGIIEAAHGGSLFLDEVADMALNTQAKVLRVLQEREIRRIGSTTTTTVDIRVIAATNKNLAEQIRAGAFREDLFYRLNVIPITLPPLHQRIEDIPTLVTTFLQRRGRAKAIDADAMKCLCSYHWPGNVRELEAVVERMAILSSGVVISKEDLPEEIRKPRAHLLSEQFQIPPQGVVFEELERNLLQQALYRSNGILADAARLLGMTYRTFQYRAEKFGLLENRTEKEKII